MYNPKIPRASSRLGKVLTCLSRTDRPSLSSAWGGKEGGREGGREGRKGVSEMDVQSKGAAGQQVQAREGLDVLVAHGQGKLVVRLGREGGREGGRRGEGKFIGSLKKR